MTASEMTPDIVLDSPAPCKHRTCFVMGAPYNGV